jgi:GTP cyclohydrolase I
MRKGTVFDRRPGLVDALSGMFRELGVPQQEWEDRGLDIHNTPARVAKMLREELLASYKPGAYEDLCRRFTCFASDGMDSLVVEGPIDFHSMCAHHMLTFSGEAYVGYLPGPLLVGASKLVRAVDYYARMLQIQERMGRQIADFVMTQAQAKASIVLLKANHLCMRCRGVKQSRTSMLTTAIRPEPAQFGLDSGLIQEFYQAVELLRGA